jgi:hypothetical protein
MLSLSPGNAGRMNSRQQRHEVRLRGLLDGIAADDWRCRGADRITPAPS